MQSSNDNLTKIDIFCDGGSRGNPGPAASAFVAQDPSGKILYQSGTYLGKATNNYAEYQAVLKALIWLQKNFSPASLPKSVFFYLDSRLIVNQILGNFKVKEPGLVPVWLSIKTQIQNINHTNQNTTVSFNHIPRALNFRADKLVNDTLDTLYQF